MCIAMFVAFDDTLTDQVSLAPILGGTPFLNYVAARLDGPALIPVLTFNKAWYLSEGFCFLSVCFMIASFLTEYIHLE